MKKPGLIIDVLSGPGDEEEEEETPIDDEEAARPSDAHALIAGIEQQLAELRRALGEAA